MNLYRNKKEGKIAGVCAGLADHFDFDPWVMRLVWLGAFFFLQSLAVIAYIIAIFMMAPKSKAIKREQAEAAEHRRDERTNMFKYSPSPSSRLRKAHERLNDTLRRVEDMEAYVTSRQYKLDREFANIDR
jgi:phage shock protein C